MVSKCLRVHGVTLSSARRAAVERYYERIHRDNMAGMTIGEIAKREGRSKNGLYVALFHWRQRHGLPGVGRGVRGYGYRRDRDVK